MKKATTIINVLYAFIVLLFLLDALTSVDLKKQFFKSVVYFGFLFGAPLVLLWNLFVIQPMVNKVVGMVYPTIFIVLATLLGPIKIFTASGAWRTQTILYEHGHLNFKTIEFQMQDIGAMGYNRRTVEVMYLTPLFTISSNVASDIDKRVEWIKVDRDINELELKFP